MTSRTAPIVVVGQPRSGSTITTRVLNEFDGVFLLNDFYALQAIDAESLWDRTDPAGAARIAEIVLERVTVRATQEEGKTLEQSIDLSAEGLAKVTEFARQDRPQGSHWHDVLGGILTKAAQEAGCDAWGWNTPQDHLHLERIFAAWPEARALFVLREPRAVLRSYKNVSGPWHDARRYNPATIGLAWKVAAQNYHRWKAQRPGQVAFLSYEKLVAETEASTALLADLIGKAAPSIDLASFGKNSSHGKDRKSKPVTGAELWLCQKVIGEELEKIGFSRDPAARPTRGAFELAARLARSGLFIGTQILTDADRRKRALNFLRR